MAPRVSYIVWRECWRELVAEGALADKRVDQTAPEERAKVWTRVALKRSAEPYGGLQAMINTWEEECKAASGPFNPDEMIRFLERYKKDLT